MIRINLLKPETKDIKEQKQKYVLSLDALDILDTLLDLITWIPLIA